MTYTRITIPLTFEEREALAKAASADLRTPRDQVRYLVRVGLGMNDQGKHNGAAQAVTGECGAAVTMAG